jgi:hypothetical protein
LHLFRGCVLFESLLKSAPGAPQLQTLGNALHYYRDQLGLRGEILTKAHEFNHTVAALNANLDVDDAIYLCAQTRNTVGHNLVWSAINLNPNSYEWLVRNIAVSCLHAVSALFL